MIDFEKMLEEEEKEKPTNPLEIFQGSVRNEKYEYLRSMQEHVLETWYSRKDERDIIVKMNTGSGKTLVGLLMLQSCLNEGQGPAIYLCLDNQLVEQVVSVANECGINVVTFNDSSYSIPFEFQNSEAILVTTFQKMVNGKSVFGIKNGSREIVGTGSLLVDDAHSCLKKAREAFTISLNRSDLPSTYYQVLSLFKHSLHTQSPGKLKDLEDEVPGTLLAIPYWAWIDSVDDVIKILAEIRTNEQMVFKWNLLNDNLRNCSCFISEYKIEITPHCVPIEYIPSFYSASKRFFLSATLLDDSHLIKEFAVSYDAVLKPLTPKISGDIGERMIIIPSFIDPYIEDDDILQLVIDTKNEGHNIAVLTPSYKSSEKWEYVENVQIAHSGNISSVLNNLIHSKNNIAVFTNRYDGVDLPGESCRLLVMDGKPQGQTLFEIFTNRTRPGSKLLKAIMAQRIEQGLGRGVRSGADYCVVIILGDELVSFLSLNYNQNLLSAQTRNQIKLGLALGKELRDESDSISGIYDLMDKCLKRDSSWIKYHRQMIQNTDSTSTEMLPIKLAAAERKSFEYSQKGQFAEAVNCLESAVDEVKASLDPEDKGWYLQLASSYTYSFDRVKSMEMQLKAHSINTYLCRPPDGVCYQKMQKLKGMQANRILSWVQSHAESNGILVDANSILSKLQFGVLAEPFEETVKNLGELLGCDSQRPEKEYGKGPDVLWQLADGTYLIIEAKSEVDSSNLTISKKYANQLDGSWEWFKKEYAGNDGIPVMIHPYDSLAEDAYLDEEAMLINTDKLSILVKNVTGFVTALTTKSPDSWVVEDISRLLKEYKLDSANLKNVYLFNVSK